MTAQEELAAKPVLYAQKPCCAVPLSQGNPDCVWHGYRSLTNTLALHHLPEEVCAHALKVETRAQVNAIEFVRRGIIATAQEETAKGYDPLEVMAKLVDRLNTLIADLGK